MSSADALRDLAARLRAEAAENRRKADASIEFACRIEALATLPTEKADAALAVIKAETPEVFPS